MPIQEMLFESGAIYQLPRILLAIGAKTKHEVDVVMDNTAMIRSGELLKLLVIQTANSVSAFTPNMAPTFIDGVKCTLPSRYPDAIICDLETLQDAPKEMTIAGVGDLLQIYVSRTDGIRMASLDSMAILAKLIALGGIAMSLSHATTPMSGYEHMMSPILYMFSELLGFPLAQHGSQIAITSLVGARAFKQFLCEFHAEKKQPHLCYPSFTSMVIS